MVQLQELWRRRELLLFLAWRDVRVRYRQTVLGAVWALLEPLLGALLFTLIFNRLARLEAGPIPYALHCYVGLMLWTFFARGLRATTVSLVANASLLTKAYFPRLALPLAAQLATVVDFGCAGAVYVALALYYGAAPGIAVITVPLWVGLGGLAATGIGLLLAAVNVRFRDVSQAVPFLTQIWMFATPVAYPLAAIPAAWRGWYTLNPMVGVVEGLRWALLPGYAFDPLLVAPSLGVTGGLLVVGLTWFRRTEVRFADVV
ncbi:MAG: ABC transporter permease [Planctomycetota bacterium]